MYNENLDKDDMRFGLNKDLNQGIWKANVGFQNQKGNILNAGYMKINGQDYGVFDYNFSILKIMLGKLKLHLLHLMF